MFLAVWSTYRIRRLNPRLCNVHVDANALDRDGSPRDELVSRFREISDAGEINIVVSNTVRSEILHPNTPGYVKEVALLSVFTICGAEVEEERKRLVAVQAILRGNARPGKHDRDADHIFHASKYGGGYFVTEDQRILARRRELDAVIGPSLAIVTLEEFFSAYD